MQPIILLFSIIVMAAIAAVTLNQLGMSPSLGVLCILIVAIIALVQKRKKLRILRNR